MVDLVKIRKKAREQKESESPTSGDQASEANGTASGNPETAAGKERSSAARTTGKGTGKSRKGSKKKDSGQTAASKEEKPSATDSEHTPASSSSPKEDSPAESPASAPAAASPVSPAVEETGSGESRLSRFKRTAGVMEEGSVQEESDEEEASDEDLLEVITFNLAGEQYAMDVDHLVEIIVPRASTRVPNASEEVVGIISLRGSIVTLLDLRKILAHPGRGEETEDTRIVVVQHENERLGFTVDKVLRVVKVERSSIEPQPIVSAAEHDDVVRGVFVSGDAITIYLDLQRIAGEQSVS